MEIHKSRILAPDPLTEPEKCSGLRTSFMLISILGIAIFVFAALALCTPSIYSFLRSTVEFVVDPDMPDAIALQHGSGPPVFAR